MRKIRVNLLSKKMMEQIRNEQLDAIVFIIINKHEKKKSHHQITKRAIEERMSV